MAKMLGCLKKTAALVMSIALIMMELVLPMAALASDLTALPILTISYTDAYGATGMVNAMPAENQDGVLYWAQIVDPVTYPLQISAWVEGDASYYDLFMNGTTLDGLTFEVIQDTAAPDIISAVANLTAYADLEHTAWLATYPVYLSTQMLPTEEPEQPPVDEPIVPPVDEPVVPPVDEPVTPADPYAPENFGVYTPLGGIEGYITTDNRGPLNVRKTPNKDFKAIGTIPHEGSIIIHGVLDSGWYYIQYEGLIGYVYQDYVHQGSLAPIEPEQPPVDVPVEPEQPPVDVPVEPEQPPVDVPVEPEVPITPADPYAPENFGVYTSLGDIEGYITTDNRGPLNMRKTPNKDFKAIGTIPHEGSIIIHGVLDSGWYYIQYNGLDGYVSGEFVNQGSMAPVPTSADVTFNYADVNGAPLREAAVKTYDNGTYTDFSDMIPAIDGYTFQYTSTDSLYVEGGVANPSSITVTYAAVPTAADVTFYYVDASGNGIADSAVKNYANGSYTDFSDMIPAIDGYTFQYTSTDSLYVEGGVANPSSITVTYAAIPTAADVTFYYVDASGNGIADSAVKNYANGSYTDFSDMIPAIEGYDYQYASTDLLTVDAGVASPEAITITYAAKVVAPSTADVTFFYVDADGITLRDAAVKTYENGTYTDFSDMILAIEGYDYQYASTDLLIVDAGVASPEAITITYAAKVVAPSTADVTFFYVDADGITLRDAAVKTYENGTYTDFSDMILAIEGYDYQYASTDSLYIENGVANPSSITVTYAAKVVAPSTADVTFFYVDESGAPLQDASVKTYENGVHTNFADMVPAIDGYDFLSLSADSLTVDAGVATPDTITVTYAQKAPSTADVTFHYVDVNNTPLLEDTVKTYQNGTYTDFGDMIPGIPGHNFYALSTGSLTVENGVANPAAITVTYKLPVTAPLNIRYVVDGVEFFGEQRTLNVGTVTISPDASIVPEGYTPVNVEPVTVTLSEDGTLTPAEVSFTYEKVVIPTSADITLRFVDNKGNVLKENVVTLEEGHYTDINEFISNFDGYSYQGASADAIVVTGGVATPDTITFMYLKNTTAVLEVRYVDPIGQVLSTETLSLRPQADPHKISPNPSMIPDGYKLSPSGNTLPTLVTVEDADKLVAKPNLIEFHLVSADVRATVTVNYMTTDGKQIATTTIDLEPGTHILTPDAALLPDGYEIITSPEQKQQVSVSDTGVPNLSNINFYCKEQKSTIYVGYALVTNQTALRNAYNMKDSSIITTLPGQTLVFVNGQATVDGTLWSSAQTVLGGRVSGVLPDSALRHISDAEASTIIAKWKEENPTPSPSPTPAPTLSGYYKTTTSVMVMRSQPNVYASYVQLPQDAVIYITGEGVMNGANWYTVNYNGNAGYIRADQAAMLRKMSNAEIDKYLDKNPEPTPTVSNQPYDPYGDSSYGYVTSSSVNFRETPSTSGKRIKVLYRYAFGMIIGSKEVNGATWYYINQNGVTGWVHGNYFRQLNLTELNSFLVSSEYKQGIANNSGTSSESTGGSTTGSTSTGSTGSATQGNISSVEDWNVGAWQNTGVTSPSYKPFNPYATATPAPTLAPEEELEPGNYSSSTLVKLYQSTSKSSTITPVPANTQLTIREKLTANNAEWYLVSYNGKLLYLEAEAAANLETAADASPTASVEPIFTMIPIDYEPEEVSTSSAPWGLIVGGVILLGGAGGVYAYALNQNKKRKAAARRNAARRPGNGGPQGGQTRRAVAAPTVSGSSNPYGTQQQPNPYGTQQNAYGTGNQNPYASTGNTSSWAAPSADSSAWNASSGQNAYAPSADNAFPTDSFAPPADASAVNPFAPPADTSAPNPYAPPADYAAQRSNPYARPIEPQSSEANGDAVRRRSTRRERYHSADGSDSTEG